MSAIELASAQVITDGTVGPSVALPGPDYAITDDLGTQVGGNLFHSFDTFSIDTGQSATFSGPASVDNVISRVTGGSVSEIDGALRSTIPGADVFLINPSGVVFGPNASLDVQGSFSAGTANEVTFPDGGRFSASDPGASVLSVAPPEAFGFLGAPSGTLRVDGSQISVNHDLTFIGPEVVIDGTNGFADPDETIDPGGRARITTQGGDLRIESPGASGLVRMDLLPPPRPADTAGSVRIFRADIDTSGAPSGGVRLVAGQVTIEKTDITAENTGDEPGGGLFIAGQSIAFREDPFSFPPEDPDFPFFTDRGNQGRCECPGSAITIDNRGTGPGGGVEMRALDIELSGAFFIGTETFATGSSGDIVLDATNIEILEGVLGPGTMGDGDSGDLFITADRFVLDGNENGIRVFTGFATDTRGSGAGGDIIVEAREVELIDGGRFGTFVTPPSEIIDGERVITGDATGPGGDVTVRAETILIRGEDAFRTGIDANTEGSGPAGTLTIDATSVVLDGIAGLDPAVVFRRGNPGRTQLGVASFPESGKNGDAGAIVIRAESVRLLGFAFVSAQTFTGGAGGPISIDTGLLELRDGPRISTFSIGGGDAGEITINADRIVMSAESNPIGAARIESVALNFFSGSNTANAGAITVTAPILEMLSGSSIDALTLNPSLGGDITIESDHITVIGGGVPLDVDRVFRGSDFGFTRINSSADNGGTAGNITLGAERVVVDEAALITTQARRGATGGSITVNADTLTVGGRATLDAGTTGAGPGGNIFVNALGAVVLRDFGSGLLVESASAEPDAGLAGDIFVGAHTLRIEDGARISTSSAVADGGNITIDAIELVYVSTSSITTSVGDGTGSGGNILIDPVFVVLDDALIQANAFGGPGGNITIIAENFLASPLTIISASSAQSVDGTISIEAPETDLSGAVAPLSGELLDAAERLAAQCAARGGQARATFIGRGRSGLPIQPGDPIIAHYGEAAAGTEMALLAGRLEVACTG